MFRFHLLDIYLRISIYSPFTVPVTSSVFPIFSTFSFSNLVGQSIVSQYFTKAFRFAALCIMKSTKINIQRLPSNTIRWVVQHRALVAAHMRSPPTLVKSAQPRHNFLCNPYASSITRDTQTSMISR